MILIKKILKAAVEVLNDMFGDKHSSRSVFNKIAYVCCDLIASYMTTILILLYGIGIGIAYGNKVFSPNVFVPLTQVILLLGGFAAVCNWLNGQMNEDDEELR